MRSRAVLVRMGAVFMSCNSVLLGLCVTAMVVMVRSH